MALAPSSGTVAAAVDVVDVVVATAGAGELVVAAELELAEGGAVGRELGPGVDGAVRGSGAAYVAGSAFSSVVTPKMLGCWARALFACLSVSPSSGFSAVEEICTMGSLSSRSP